MGIVICFSVEQEDAGVGGDNQTHVVHDDEASTAFEGFFCEEYLDVAA